MSATKVSRNVNDAETLVDRSMNAKDKMSISGAG